MPVRIAVIALLVLCAASSAPRAIAADWADPTKVLRIAFPIDVSGLDPAGTQETYATAVEGRIFDALYRWDYLTRPFRFVRLRHCYPFGGGAAKSCPTTEKRNCAQRSWIRGSRLPPILSAPSQRASADPKRRAPPRSTRVPGKQPMMRW